jgi:hypothetical protein
LAQPVATFVEEDEQRVEEDGFSVVDLGGNPADVLAALRTRLLDLTLTNRLLNFKHGARTVRVIDELPDQLFERLREGAELEFLPVPEPPRDHPLRKAGAAIPKKERAHAATSYAAERGFATSYDLPEPTDGDAPDHHADDAIQTLLFPSDLERVLRAIAADARSAIEEKGSNVLYLAFGFLEWSESEDAKKTILSPLLMLPVSLRRGDPDPETGAYRFFVSYSNDDVIPNISLQEKLRRDFHLELPDVLDDDTPDTYLARIKDTVPFPERWKLQRQISLGLLLFTKLLMYRDLDPANWPAGKSLTEHPRLLELFGAGGSGEMELAREYDFERGHGSHDGQDGAGDAHDASAKKAGRGAAVVGKVPAIIVDADSSQHSAIVDAVAGRNLVVEGPPGTGKSQTIANLIAAALGDPRGQTKRLVEAVRAAEA